MKKLYLLVSFSAFIQVITLAQSPHAAQLYGMTEYGSYNKKGSIFHYTPSTHTFTNDYNFQIKAKGRTPKCEMVAGNNGKYYGTTTAGGDYNAGVLFEWDSVTSVYKNLHNFTGSDGRDARGGMVLYNNKLYGTTNAGGTNNYGVIYEWNIAENTYTKKIDLDSAGGRNATGSLTVVNDLFYGFTNSGGVNDKGVLFEWNPATNVYTKKFDFDNIKGSNPVGRLTPYNGKLYAMCNKGGAFNAGTIYQWDFANNTVTKTFDFNNTNGAFPMGYLTLYNNKFYGTTNEGGIYQTSLEQTGILRHYGVIFEYNPANNAFAKKKDLGFNGDFRGPLGSLTLKGGVFWSTASEDAIGAGGIFTWNPATNQFVGKYSFSAYSATPCEIETPAIGTQTFESLLVSGNYLLGSASEGGGNNFGTLYKFLPDSNQITGLVNMEATDGAYPKGSLTKLGNKLFGLTYQGGNSHAGNIFEWDLTTHQYKERFQLDGLTTGIWPKGSLTYYNGKFYGINSKGKLIAGAASFNQRDPGDYFSWNPVTNIYQSLLSAGNARATPVVVNNKMYSTAQFPTNDFGGVISAFDPAANTLTNAAYFPDSLGNFSGYQGVEGANGVTYYNGKFYGMTTGKISSGNTPFRGTIYEWDTTKTVITHRYDFTDSIGIYPTGNLLLVGNEFYGLASNYGNPSGLYPTLFKWNPATNVLQKMKTSINSFPFGTPAYSGGKIYFSTESGFLNLYEYDPVLDTTIIVYNEPIPLFQPGGNWNYTNCTAPPSYQQLLEVIPNEAPVLVSIPSAQNTCINKRDSASFTITDTDLDTMHFRIKSSNTSLMPVANISVSNTGNLYTIIYFGNANQTGSTTISVTANDGYGDSVSFSFPVTILAATQSPCNALPVTMLSFSVKADASTSLLTWQTTAEYNTKGYDIERSFDGATFIKIGFVTAAGSATGSTYSYVDATPQKGYNYYRLKTVDINGAYTYSTIQNTLFTAIENIVVYPNPVTDILWVKINTQGKNVSLVLTDVAGKKLFEAINPKGQLIKIPLAKRPAGVYVLTLFNGTNNWTKKIVKE